tara:strand:- start:161439 stop:162311 length:873 start_codon:yes stop_codon:yes gene_type:complete
LSAYQRALDSREVGDIPISYGSSRPISAMMGGEVDTTNISKHSKPDEVKISIKTLFRNMWSCTNADVREKIPPEMFADALIDEIIYIKQNLRLSPFKSVKLDFFLPDYSYLRSEFSYAVLKPIKTERDKAYHEKEEKACKAIMDNLEKVNEELDDLDKIEITKTKGEIKSSYSTIWLMTHNPVDILAMPLVRTVRTIDSHTAVVRGPRQWTDKLTNSKKLERIPFNKLTLQVFGDKARHFSPMSPGHKKFLLKMAEEKKWNRGTSLNVMKISINGSPDRFSATAMLRLAK